MFNSEGGRRRRSRGLRRTASPEVQRAWPTHESDQDDREPVVLAAEHVVTAAMGRWAADTTLYAEGSQPVQYRTVLEGRERFKLLAAAAREDAERAA